MEKYADHRAMLDKLKKNIRLLKSTSLLKKDDEARFRLQNGFKMALIPLCTLSMTVIFFSFFLEMDLIFFEANGFIGASEYRETYYDFVFSKMMWVIPSILIFLVCVFIMGIYISELLLRPFKVLRNYCAKAIDDQEASYDPDFFTDLKLLTSFSEWFFNMMENAIIQGELKPQKVPIKFTKIHGPTFEKSFFIHYSLFILITSICAAVVINTMAIDLHHQIIELSYNVLEVKPEIQYFFSHQEGLFANTLYVILTFHIFAYIGLAFHLYAKISVPAFAFFSTMRSFSKGTYDNRVHLLGYSFIRPYSRIFNQYLDKYSKELIKNRK